MERGAPLRPRARSTSQKLVEQHVLEILEELQALASTYRPFVTGIGPRVGSPPDKGLLDLRLKMLDRKARWSGASRWARSQLARSGGASDGPDSRWPGHVTPRAAEVEARHRKVIELGIENPGMTWERSDTSPGSTQTIARKCSPRPVCWP